MNRQVLVQLTLPAGWKSFTLPKVLDERLHELIDRENKTRKLSARERREANALVKVVEMLSLLKARAAQAKRFGKLTDKK